ncbi:hypothetical protein [Sorangium sp. So ce1153]
MRWFDRPRHTSSRCDPASSSYAHPERVTKIGRNPIELSYLDAIGS